MTTVYVVLTDCLDKTSGALMGAIVDSVWRSYDKAEKRVNSLLSIGEDTISYPYINVQIMDD